jgi:S-adenosylmethionine decarboxylase
MLLKEILNASDFHPKAWGFQLILDCSHCNSSIVTDKDELITFVDELIKEIDMVIVGKPMVKHFPQRDPGKTGLSLVQLIETSSITCHCVDKTKDVYLDIFSCKEFSYEDAAEFVKLKLKPEHIRVDFLTRDA